MACDMSEPCKLPSLDSCQKSFMWTHKDVDIAPHPVVGLVLQVENAEKFPSALCFESLDPFFFESARRVHVSQPQRRMEVTRDSYNLNFLAKLMVVLHQIRFNLALAASD